MPNFINPIGTIQGGIIAAMLDDAMGPVATAFLGGFHMAPTVELKTSFMHLQRSVRYLWRRRSFTAGAT